MHGRRPAHSGFGIRKHQNFAGTLKLCMGVMKILEHSPYRSADSMAVKNLKSAKESPAE